jgi:hypothetical protein
MAKLMATDPQIRYILGLERYAPGRVEAAKLSWGDDLWDMPKQEAAMLINLLVELKKRADDEKAAGESWPLNG